MVIALKFNENTGLCVGMRQAKKAIVRHRFPVPTVGELLLDLNGAVMFSEIDTKVEFHQFVLSEESRGIATFATHADQKFGD